MSVKGIEFLAHLATLGAFFAAMYAIAVPETVSSYLNRVAAGVEQTAQNTKDIAETSRQISENTDLLSQAVPYWFTKERFAIYPHLTEDSPNCETTVNKCVIRFNFLNDSSFDIKDVSVEIKDENLNVIVSRMVPVAISDSTIRIEEMNLSRPRYVCIKGTVSALNNTYYEYLEITQGENSPVILDRLFSTDKPQNC